MTDVKTLTDKYIASTYSRFPLTLVSGKGSLVYDDGGKEYIDLGTGIAVNGFGVGDEEWKRAVTAQLDKIPHTSNLYYSEPAARLAALIAEKTGMRRTFFSNSGAEANECAFKIARKYASDRYGSHRNKIITLEGSFHGRTLTTLAATGQKVFHELFTPLTPGFIHVSAGDVSGAEREMKSGEVAAVMIEIVQGEGGVIALDEDFVKNLERICRENDVLLMCDEVQCGNGRSGELYAYMNYKISPDVFTTAKGLGGGLPIGATVMSEKVENVLTPSTHGSTFGGNPAACAGAYSILSRIDEKLLDGVKKRSDYLFSELGNASGVISVSGMGLMIGVETVKPASEVIDECRNNGVLVIKAKNKVRLLPALNIPEELLCRATKVLKNACKI